MYRRYLSRVIVDELGADNIFISLDETSVSSAHQSVKFWTLLGHSKSYIPIRTKNHSNLTVLIAVSRNKVEGVMIKEGFVNQIFFSEFISQLHESIKCQTVDANKTITIIMDNLRAHCTPKVKEILRRRDIKVIYNAPYSPSLTLLSSCS